MRNPKETVTDVLIAAEKKWGHTLAADTPLRLWRALQFVAMTLVTCRLCPLIHSTCIATGWYRRGVWEGERRILWNSQDVYHHRLGHRANWGRDQCFTFRIMLIDSILGMIGY